ncbi:MAG TPA: F0F1 ATP synthase subunit B [Thermomicrobiales bacterium]|nr:F0F1 ATP synthase subunit B [Thermomicrobiales bacterium]
MAALGLNVWNLIAQIIAFLIFIWLFWRYALGPIVRMIDERQARVRASMEAAQEIQQELAATTARNEELLGEARQEAQRIVRQARDAEDAIIGRARDEANKQADEYLARAEAALRQETNLARQQLRQEVADLAVLAASKIVRKELDPATQTRLIEEALTTTADGSANGAEGASA